MEYINITKGELRLINKNLVCMINDEIISLATNVLTDHDTPSHQIDFVCAKITILNGLRDKLRAWRTQHESTEKS